MRTAAATHRPMKHTPIKRLIETLGVSQASLARRLKVSGGTLSDAINHNTWPRDKTRLADALQRLLIDAGAHPSKAQAAFEKQIAQGKPGRPTAQGTTTPRAYPSNMDYQMLLRKQTITQATRQHFSLKRDPFGSDISSVEDVFLSPDIRYVREAMWTTAKHGGMLAVIGESGAGKSTLRREFIDRIAREEAHIIAIEPYVTAMEDAANKGKPLKAFQIAEAIVSTLDPLAYLKSSAEARFRQVHNALKASHQAGNRHVLVIEEAHCMAPVTLKHLKRFLELEVGFTKLLSIILIGQTELDTRLSENNLEVREVVQRCEIAHLAPLNNALTDFLNFKLQRVGSSFDAVFAKDAVDALRAKLSCSGRKTNGAGGGDVVSQLYPLAVANVVSAAMNMAASIGKPRVDADVIKEV